MNPNLSLFKKFKDTGKQSAIYGLGAILQPLAAFILLPLYTTALTPTDYGILGLVVMTGKVLGVIFALGLRPGMFRSFYDYTEEKAQKVVVSTTIILTAISSLFLVLFGILFSSPLAHWLLGSQTYQILLVIIIFSTVFNLFNQITFSIFRIQHQAKKYVLFQLSFFFIRVGIIIYMVSVMHLGVYGVLGGQLITAILSFIILFKFTKYYLLPRFSVSEAKKMFQYGAPLIFVGLFGFISTYADRYIINYYMDLQEVGLYTLAYQLGMLMSITLVTPTKLVWAPAFLSVKDYSNFKDFSAKALTYLLFIGGFLFLGIALLSKEVLHIMSNPKYWSAYTIVPIIALTYLIWSTRSILEVGITLKRKTSIIALYMFIGAIINLFLNVLLIPSYGMTGAAYATLFSFTITLFIDYFYNRRLLKINYEWNRIIKLTITIATLFFIGYLSPFDNLYVSIAIKLLLIGLYPLLLLLIGFYSQAEILRIKQIALAVFSKAKGFI